MWDEVTGLTRHDRFEMQMHGEVMCNVGMCILDTEFAEAWDLQKRRFAFTLQRVEYLRILDFRFLIFQNL